MMPREKSLRTQGRSCATQKRLSVQSSQHRGLLMGNTSKGARHPCPVQEPCDHGTLRREGFAYRTTATPGVRVRVLCVPAVVLVLRSIQFSRDRHNFRSCVIINEVS